MIQDVNGEWAPIIPWPDDPVPACRHCRRELVGRPVTEVEFVRVVSDQHSRDMQALSREFAPCVRDLLQGDRSADGERYSCKVPA